MQNRMGLFSTATKLFVWCLRLRVQKAQSLQYYWHWVVKMKNMSTNTNICWLYWILSSQMTKTFRDNCNINIVQQTNCELFPSVQMQLKMYFFVPFLHACMHHNYGITSWSHACMWPTILDAELYTTCPGERVLVAIRFNVIFLHSNH